MSPPPGNQNRLYDHYSVYMGPPNTSAISPATSQFVDPVTGIYMGPPNSQKPQPMYSGYNSQQRPNPNQNMNQAPYRDPEFSEMEFNRGLRANPAQSNYNSPNSNPDPMSRTNSQYNHLPSSQSAINQAMNINLMRGGGPSGGAMGGPSNRAGYDNQFQQMSSNPNNSRRMM